MDASSSSLVGCIGGIHSVSKQERIRGARSGEAHLRSAARSGRSRLPLKEVRRSHQWMVRG